jgi:hypothetical protein
MRTILAAFFIVISTWATAAQTEQLSPQLEIDPSEVQKLGLSHEAAQVAVEIGVAPLLLRLQRLSSSSAGPSAVSLQSLAVRQEITERVLATSLEIDGVNAVIDVELEQIRSIRSDLQARRDKAQNIINLASIVTGGAFGAVTSAMQFEPGTVNLGTGIGVAGGAGSVLLSIIGIHKKGGRRTLGDSPRMLARFFGRQPEAQEIIPSRYPPEIWSYLNSATPYPGRVLTRTEQLIAKWRTEGRIHPNGSPKEERKIESMSNSISHSRELSIGNLDDRIAMLLDVRANVSLMKRDLSEVLQVLRSNH